MFVNRVDVETCNSCYNGGTCIRKNGADTCICPGNYYFSKLLKITI